MTTPRATPRPAAVGRRGHPARHRGAATPTAGWRIRRRRRPSAWSAAQDALLESGRRSGDRVATGWRRGSPSCSARASSARRPGAATGSSSCAAPPSRSTPCCSPSTPTAPSACSSTRSRVDPTGATTLDAWQPSKEGDLLAYQLSARRHRGVACCTSWTSRPVSSVEGPIDRTRYSPVAWLPGGEAFYYVRRLRAGAGARRRGAVPPPGLAAPARHRPGRRRRDLRRRAGQDQLLRRHRVDGRPLAGRSARRPAPRRATTCGWPTSSDGRLGVARTCAVVQEGVDASTSLHVGRDGRVYVFTDRDAPRGRLAVTDARRPGVRRRGPTWCPRTTRRCSRATRSWTAPELRRRRRRRSCCAPGPGTR